LEQNLLKTFKNELFISKLKEYQETYKEEELKEMKESIELLFRMEFEQNYVRTCWKFKKSTKMKKIFRKYF
jgi:hypothetical protein